MKKFEMPMIETVKFEVADVITTSGIDLGNEEGICMPEV